MFLANHQWHTRCYNTSLSYCHFILGYYASGYWTPVFDVVWSTFPFFSFSFFFTGVKSSIQSDYTYSPIQFPFPYVFLISIFSIKSHVLLILLFGERENLIPKKVIENVGILWKWVAPLLTGLWVTTFTQLKISYSLARMWYLLHCKWTKTELCIVLVKYLVGCGWTWFLNLAHLFSISISQRWIFM